jgi:hypothetical protein
VTPRDISCFPTGNEYGKSGEKLGTLQFMHDVSVPAVFFSCPVRGAQILGD